MFALLVCSVLAAEPAADWQRDEAVHLNNIKQVTKDFVRAGEGYFSPDGKTIIFQAEEKDGGNPFYQIFAMNLATGAHAASAPASARRPALLLARRQEDHLRQQPSRSRGQEDIRREYDQRDEDARPASAAVIAGTSTRTWTSSRPTLTAPI